MTFALAVLLAASCAAAALPHPRLILTPSRLVDVKSFIANNTQAAAYYRSLQLQGAHVLPQAPLPRPPENASDILMAARTVLTRTYVTSLLWRLTGNETWAARAVAEMLSYTSWSDWNLGGHALDCGELAHATAIGLDWTYEYLSAPGRAAQLAAVVAGLVRNGLMPFYAAYAAGAKAPWWTVNPSNWAVVTNGGAGLAALALAGEAGAPGWLPDLLANATRGVRSSAGSAPDGLYGGGYGPEGSWWEGPIYHGYASRYFVPFVSGLESATGDDGGLWALPGVAQSARYQMAALDPSFRYFNWADSEEGQETLAMLLSVAGRAGDGAAAFTLRARLDAASIPVSQIDNGGQDAMEYAHALLYFSAAGAAADRAALPLDAALPAKKLAFFRSSWTDPGAAFVGVKACNCSWNHGDLDSGTFVYTWGTHRFVADLGADNYGLPGYFGPQRFDYYRKNSRGHNVLQFGNATHTAADCFSHLSGASDTFLTAFSSGSAAVYPGPPDRPPLAPCALRAGEAACVQMNVSAAFAGQGVTAASRRFAVDAATRTQLTVSDAWTLAAAGEEEVEGAGAVAAPTAAAAAFHTYAAVAVAGDGRSATLTLGTASVRIDVPAGGACSGGVAFTATRVALPPPQGPSTGLVRVDALFDPRACAALDIRIAPVVAAAA